MTRSNKVLIVMTVFTLGMVGMWGCARKPVHQSASNDRVQALESRCVQLEHDYRTVAGARDQARKQVSALEETQARAQKDLASHQATVKERDALSRQARANQEEIVRLHRLLAERTQERDALQSTVADRTTERDTLQGRVEKLKKGLHTLLSAEETATGSNTSAPAGPAVGVQ